MRSFRRFLPIALAALVGAGGVIAAPAPADAAGCLWTIDGHIKVSDLRVEGQATTEPLDGVEVKVSGRSAAWGLWLTFNEWARTETDSDGHFRVTHTQCGARNVKVMVKFEDADLHVKGNGNKEWYDVFFDSVSRAPGTVPVGTMTFGANRDDDLDHSAGRSNAETWVVYRKALDHLDDIGHPIGMTQLTVHNPFDTVFTSDDSYVDPITDDIHIHEGDEFDLETMLHELGHAVMFPLVTGEDCLMLDLATTFDTHQQVESGCVAFHEGTAEYIGEQLENELIESGEFTHTDDGLLPGDRAFVDQTLSLDTISEMEHNDEGWFQLHKIMGRNDLTNDLFGLSSGTPTAPSPRSPACFVAEAPVVGLAKTLKVLDALDTDTAPEIDFDSYLGRVDDVLTTVEAGDLADWLDVADPTEDVEPCEAFGSMTSQPAPNPWANLAVP